MVLHFETFFLSEISVTKDGNECSCDNVVTRQQHYFCRFLAQSFRGWRFKRLYNNGQDIPRRCLFLPLTNPHPLTLYYPKMLVSS